MYVLPIKGDCQHDTTPTLTNPNLHISKYRFTLLHDYHSVTFGFITLNKVMWEILAETN